jgi:endo-1,4-beta-xylanase
VAPQNQWGITLWNIADPKSFLNIVKFWFDIRFLGGSEYPLLWDADYNPKPAYYGFHNGLQGVAEGWLWPIFSNKD